jgi:drug/metabolite transporter (DMT)-like permease
MTLYMLIGRVVRQTISVTLYTFIVYLSSATTLFLLNLALKKPFYPYPAKEWVLFLAMALICTVLGHNVLNWALKYLNPTFISTAILGEPVFATFWALLLFQEYPGGYQLLGSSIVIFGLLMVLRKMDQN